MKMESTRKSFRSEATPYGAVWAAEAVPEKQMRFQDQVNVALDKAAKADGFIFGSPVHYASAGGAITSFLDRMFFAGKENMVYKPGAAVVSCRRAGSTATLDQLNKYFTISSMPLVGSSYWNMVHGNTPEEVLQDKEGLQTMRNLARNMAWLLHCIEAGKKRESLFLSRNQAVPPTLSVNINKKEAEISVCGKLPLSSSDISAFFYLFRFLILYHLISLSSKGSPHSGQNLGGWAGSSGSQPHLSHL